jgi:hypothetical protein
MIIGKCKEDINKKVMRLQVGYTVFCFLPHNLNDGRIIWLERAFVRYESAHTYHLDSYDSQIKLEKGNPTYYTIQEAIISNFTQ